MDISRSLNKLRKAVATFTVATLVASLLVIAPAHAAVPSEFSWAESGAEALGDPEFFTSEALGADVTKCVFSQVLMNALELDAAPEAAEGFTDVPEWAMDAVGAMVENNIAEGRDPEAGVFGCADSMSRAEGVVMVSNAFNLCSLEGAEDGSVDAADFEGVEWAMEAFECATGLGVVNQSRPTDTMSKAESFVLAYRSMDPANNVEEDTSDDSDDAASEGALTVRVASSSPAGTTIADKASGVEVAVFEFDADDDAVELNGFTLHKFGVGSLPSSFLLYVYDGDDRLTSGKSVNSSENEARFNNLNLTIPAGTSKELRIVADIGTADLTSSQEFGLELESVDAVSTNAESVSGTFPAKAALHVISATDAGTVTVTKNGTVTDVALGTKGATIAKFKLSTATEDGLVKRLGFYLTGTVSPDDVGNFKLYASGSSDPLAEVASLNSRDVMNFVLDTPFEIAKGDDKTFWITADFMTGRSGDTVLVYVDETTDINVIGDTYGFGMAVTATAYDGSTCSTGTPTECSALTLEGGDVTISGTSITDRDIAVNQEDVAILKFSLTSEADVTFDQFAIYLDTDASGDGLLASSGAANYTDIKISEVGGPTVWGPIDADVLTTAAGGSTVITDGGTDLAAAYYVFADDYFLEGGESVDFELTVDVENVATLADDEITASIDINSTYPRIKDSNNKVLTNSSSVVPTSDYTGGTFTVSANSLTVVRSSSVGSSTQVVGTTGIPMVAFSFGAGNAQDIKITELQLTGYIEDSATTAFVAGADTTTYAEVVLAHNLYVGSVAEENKLNTSSKSANSSTGEFTFNKLDWTIPAGETKTLIVTGNLANNSSYASDLVKVDIADVSADVIAEDEAGNDIDSSSSDTPNGGTTYSAAGTQSFVTVSSGGSLSVDIPASSQPAQIAVAPSTGFEMAELEFTASDESFIVKDLVLFNAPGTNAATMGSYDDNINKLRLRYFTDAAQTVEATTTCAQASTTGYWNCTGLSIYVPDADLTSTPDEAVVTVEVDFNDVADSLADEGDDPRITLALLDKFEANGVASATKVTENTLSIADAASVSSFSGGSNEIAGAELATTADTVLTVDDSDPYSAGDIVCLDADDNNCDATDEQAYVVASCTAADTPHGDCTADNELILVRGVNGTLGNAAALSANDDVDLIAYTSVLATNAMEVRATDIDVTVASTSRTGSTDASEAVMTFTMTANAAKKAEVRQGYHFSATGTEGTDTGGVTTISADTAVYVDGSATRVEWDGAGAASGTVYWDLPTGDLADYARASFWVRFTDGTGSDALDASDVTLMVNEGGDALTDHELALDGTGSSLSSDPAEDVWTFVDMPLPTGTSASDTRIGFDYDGNALAAASATADGDYLVFDQLKVYNEKVNVDFTLNENWAAVTPTVAYLKQDGEVVATGYLDLDQAASSRTGQVTFVPTGSYADIEVEGASTFVVEIDTSTAISDDSSATESLKATIDFGLSGTAGDVYWYDGDATVNYFGINSTDKVTVTSQY